MHRKPKGLLLALSARSGSHVRTLNTRSQSRQEAQNQQHYTTMNSCSRVRLRIPVPILSSSSSGVRIPAPKKDKPAAAIPCRRGLLLRASLLLPLLPQLHSQAATEPSLSPSQSCGAEFKVTSSVYLDVAINGEDVGRIVIGLYGDAAPAGTARVTALAANDLAGAGGGPGGGGGFRRREFQKVTPTFVEHGGVRSLVGPARELVREREAMAERFCGGRPPRFGRGHVGLVVLKPDKPPAEVKLVAKGGRLQLQEEERGLDPNGTQLVIATSDNAPYVDAAALLVGRVVDGFTVLDRIASVKVVQDNSASPYFRAAKLIGDKRALVTEKNFYKPYLKIVVTNCGLLSNST